MNSKSYVLLLAGLVVSMVGLSMMANYLVDPWQYYRKSSIARLDGNGRIQNPGLIKNFDFELVLAGTSMAQNFQPEKAQTVFKQPPVVLAVSGGSIHEQSQTVELALSKKKVNRVVWDLHPGAFSEGVYGVKLNAFPDYLYDDSALNDLLYLFNLGNLEKSIKDLFAFLTDGEEPLDWRNTQYRGGRKDYGCPHVLQGKDGNALAGDMLGVFVKDRYLVQDEIIIQSVETNLVTLVNRFPKTRFDFYIPPFSMLYWALLRDRQPERFEGYLKVLSIAVHQLAESENVFVHSFLPLEFVSADLNHYVDLSHYTPEINSQLLHFIESQEYLVNASGFSFQINRFRVSLSHYPVASAIHACLAQSPAPTDRSEH